MSCIYFLPDTIAKEYVIDTMKKIFIIVLLSTCTLLRCESASAEPLSGDIGSSAGNISLFGTLWYSSFMNLKTPRNFKQGEEIKIKLLGRAQLVYVRLLPKGVASTCSTGMMDNKYYVSPEGVITIKLNRDYPQIQQISVHSGFEVFDKFLTLFNGHADIASVEVSMEKIVPP